MSELIFIVTIVFVAYVLFVVLAEKKESSEPSKAESIKPEEQSAEKIEVSTEKSVAVVATAAKPSRSRASAAKKTPTAKSPSPVVQTPELSATGIESLKNPKTGEITKIPANYTFVKRWIKDALVEEGLLDKVYKSAELDDAANAKIHDAMQQLKALEKYRA